VCLCAACLCSCLGFSFFSHSLSCSTHAFCKLRTHNTHHARCPLLIVPFFLSHLFSIASFPSSFFFLLVLIRRKRSSLSTGALSPSFLPCTLHALVLGCSFFLLLLLSIPTLSCWTALVRTSLLPPHPHSLAYLLQQSSSFPPWETSPAQTTTRSTSC